MDERRRQVLHLAVEHFVATNRPVASRDLAVPLGVSSATVRSELAALEQSGLLRQPHTSAGRVPTRDAYRSYAHRFLPPGATPGALPEGTGDRLQQALARAEGEGRLRLAARIASSLSGYAVAAVLAPREARVESVHLSALGDGRVLAVLVLEGGVTREFAVDAGFRPERATLDRVEEALRGLSLPLREVPTRLRTLEASGSPGVSGVARALRERWGEAAPNAVFSEGAAQVLGEPESQDVAFLRAVLELLERPALSSGDVAPGQVALSVDDPSGVSAVAAGFRSSVGPGRVVIFGPTRMRYPQAISVARAVSDALGSSPG